MFSSICAIVTLYVCFVCCDHYPHLHSHHPARHCLHIKNTHWKVIHLKSLVIQEMRHKHFWSFFTDTDASADTSAGPRNWIFTRLWQYDSFCMTVCLLISLLSRWASLQSWNTVDISVCEAVYWQKKLILAIAIYWFNLKRVIHLITERHSLIMHVWLY